TGARASACSSISRPRRSACGRRESRATDRVAGRRGLLSCAGGEEPALRGRWSMNHYDVAVVGLGIVGASAVYAAAWAGARVLALDAGAPGGGTSGTSFAWLNSVRKEPDVYHRLNAAGMTAHRDLSREL